MTRTRILKLFVVLVGVSLALAWIGATQAAQPRTVSRADVPADDEGLRLIKSDSESVILELQTSSYQIEETTADGEVCQIILAPGCGQTDDVGYPQLPVRGVLLGIPAMAEYTLRVVEVEQEVVPGRQDICPVPLPVLDPRLDDGPSQIGYEFTKDGVAYSSDALYPSSLAEIGSSGFIRDQRVVQLRFFPFRYNPVDGELTQATRIRVELAFSYPRGQPPLASASEEKGGFGQVLQNALLNYDSARQWRSASPTSLAVLPSGLGQSGTGYRVLVDEEGIYQLTYHDLLDAGMDLGDVNTSDFELRNQGEETAILVVDEGDDGKFDEEDYILFFGEPVSSTYTDTNVYWLSTGASSGLRMPERDGSLTAGTVLTYFNTTARWEEDVNYWPWIPEPATIPSEEELDHWFGGYVAAPFPPTSKEFMITLDNLAVSSPPYSGTLRGGLNGSDTVSAPYDHRVEVYLNGHLVHEALWSGQAEYEFDEDDIPHTHFLEGSNTISVECLLSDPVVAPSDIVYIDWFEIDYRRTYSAENDVLFFDGEQEGTVKFEVGGFLTQTIEVFDVTDPLSVTHFYSTTVEETGSYTLKFEDSIVGEHHYLAVSRANYRSALAVIEDIPSDLRSTSNGADYIFVTHPDFYDAILPLRDLRLSQGLDTMVVSVTDVYDEFNHGVFHPRAIRDFLAYAYDHWVSPAPSYVLLVGDGNMDFKDHLGRGEPNYIPPYLIYADKHLGEAPADNRYACVAGDDVLADMHIGRLPVQTTAQATAMVDKILNYETDLPGGDWRQEVLFVADDPDDPLDPGSPNHFWSLSDDIADNHLPPPDLFVAEKVYYGVAPYTTQESMKTAVSSAFESGRLLINYVGHASTQHWGGYPPGPFLSLADIATLPRSDKTPIVLVMGCLEGHFIYPSKPGSDWSCLAESLVRAEGKASVASWSPGSLGLSSGQHYLHAGFYDAVFRDHVYELGPATSLGKLNLYQHAGGDHWELIDTYAVFGDPALRLPVESYVRFLPLGLRGY